MTHGPRLLNQTTISTGEVLWSARSAESNDSLTEMTNWILMARGYVDRVPLPHPYSSYSAKVVPAPGDGLLITVYSQEPAFPLMSFGIAPQKCPELWQTLIFLEQPKVLKFEPEGPWCAAVLHPFLEFEPRAADWLHAFKRCCAWAWLESFR